MIEIFELTAFIMFEVEVGTNVWVTDKDVETSPKCEEADFGLKLLE
jgi:hypothetical protein